MKRFKLDPKKTPRLSKAEQKRLDAMQEADIDLSDIAEVVLDSETVGTLYRPIKRTITIRLDADVIAWFKSRHEKYQTAVNEVLRRHIEHH